MGAEDYKERLQVTLRIGNIEEPMPQIQPGNRVFHFRLGQQIFSLRYFDEGCQAGLITRPRLDRKSTRLNSSH